jgi:DNA polymerase I-like protein with 3'-5' exonuclease and polymerase domains
VLTVHDSIVFDVFPGEEDSINNLINSVFSNLRETLKRRFGFDFNIPLGWETKAGVNWLKMKELYKDDGKRYYL